MHELSIAISILDLAREEMERRGPQEGAELCAIHLALGPLAGIAKEALLSAYDLAREDSPLRACRLVIKDIPITAHCAICGGDRVVASPQRLVCPVCDAPAADIKTGRELQVTALEFAA